VTLPELATPEEKLLLANQIWLGDQPGLTQISGWIDGWVSAPSTYVVKAKTAQDVSAAVKFAQAHNLRLVVKGGGHSYVGGSSAPDSLLVWTRDMQAIEMHDAFTPQGCKAAPAPAVSVGAGCIWGRVYDAVTTRGGRYVQGGGCTTVGVAGLVQGGGFGSFSKTYGLAAASLLEAEIVTADGRVRIVNACQDPDLFWALKGGGGGTFGVVTRLTLRTHDLPAMFGAQRLAIKALSDDAFKRLIASFVDVYAAQLFNPHWGEQVKATRDNQLVCEMLFAGLDIADATRPWQSLVDFAKASPADYRIIEPLSVTPIPARNMWDRDFFARFAPTAIVADTRPGASPRDYWWKGDGEQACIAYDCIASAWLPASLLDPANRSRLVDAWFNASRSWSVSFHFNKGLAGAAPDRLAAARDTSINPQVVDAFALAIIGAGSPSIYPFAPKYNLEPARANAAKVRSAMQALRAAAPNAGSYLSESDFAKPDWQKESWGGNWPRLSEIKRRYDPRGLFVVHNGVGSEAWSADGFTRA
jgi:FAD/FMN-containing dehydrogenase